MKIPSTSVLALLGAGLATSSRTAHAFVVPSNPSARRGSCTMELQAETQSWQHWMQKTVTTAAVAASLWSAPAFLDSNSFNNPDVMMTQTGSSTVAMAKEMASGSGSRVNKDPESLLRYGLPINNKEVRYSYAIERDV